MRRLTASQYRHTIADVFGPDVTIGGRFEPEVRDGGLMAIGTSRASVSASGLEQYQSMAENVADQVLGNDAGRALYMPCKPASDTARDDACAGAFLGNVGRLLYRRPLTNDELALGVKVAGAAADSSKSFYTGLSTSLANILISPQFLFRTETDPASGVEGRLVNYSKASQLSFFLWDSGPDLKLMAAADKGELDTPQGLARQVDRLMSSPRLEQGVRAFFYDMFGFEQFATLTKDALIYPKFTAQVSKEAEEQTLRTVVDLLVDGRGDYRDLFTTKKTFLTPTLASVYKVPFVRTGLANGEPEGWKAFTFAPMDPRAGILMHVSFTALHSHEGRSSPTIRGKALRELLLCQKVPDPPGDVPFNIVQDTSNPLYKTARERLVAHRTNPVCAGCHKLVDPIGLALENFDGGGTFRLDENGAKIDTSGELDGVKFEDAVGLGKALHDNPATTSCLVTRLSSYALGRAPEGADAQWVAGLQKSFAADKYVFLGLMRRIALSGEFYRLKDIQDTKTNDGAAKPAASRTR